MIMRVSVCVFNKARHVPECATRVTFLSQLTLQMSSSSSHWLFAPQVLESSKSGGVPADVARAVREELAVFISHMGGRLHLYSLSLSLSK